MREPFRIAFPFTVRIRKYTHTQSPRIGYDVEISDLHDIFSWAFGDLREPSLYADNRRTVNQQLEQHQET